MECRIHRLTARNKLWAESSVGRIPTPGFWVTLKTFHRVYPAIDVDASFVFVFREHLLYNPYHTLLSKFHSFLPVSSGKSNTNLNRVLKNIIVLYYIPLELLNKRVFLQIRIDSLILWWTANHKFFLKSSYVPYCHTTNTISVLRHGIFYRETESVNYNICHDI